MSTLVIGAGKSGVAAANFLAARDERVVLADSKTLPELPYKLDERVGRAFGTDDAALLSEVTEIVVSPGVPLTIPLLQAAAAQATSGPSQRADECIPLHRIAWAAQRQIGKVHRPLTFAIPCVIPRGRSSSCAKS